MDAVAQARDAASTAGDGAFRRRSEAELSSALGQVRWLAERYPELAASESFLRLQAQLAEVENEIRAARGIYNSNVEIFNTLVQSFPTSLVARTAGFAPRRFFDLAPAERVPVRPLSLAT
jgi:LemA protein